MKPDVRKEGPKSFIIEFSGPTKCRQRPTKRALFGEKENVVLIFLGIAGLQGQFVRKSAKLSTQQKEGGEKLEAVKLVGCLMHPFSSGLPSASLDNIEAIL